VAQLIVPHLHGGGLSLRPFEDRDASLIQDASSDPLIPLITTVPSSDSIAEACAFIERQRERASTGAGYSFCIATVDPDEPVGQIGLWPGDPQHGRASVGYWVAARHRGRGIAATSLTIISDWALTLPGIARLELYVEPWNVGSWRSAERAGYEREGLLRQWQVVGGVRRDMYMYSKLQP
jgi:RimJ/RimL family protein N-acetyltransferase